MISENSVLGDSINNIFYIWQIMIKTITYFNAIPVGMNENRHLTECSSNCNSKAVTVGMNIYGPELNDQHKLNETTIYIYTSCGKPIKHKTL